MVALLNSVSDHQGMQLNSPRIAAEDRMNIVVVDKQDKTGRNIPIPAEAVVVELGSVVAVGQNVESVPMVTRLWLAKPMTLA